MTSVNWIVLRRWLGRRLDILSTGGWLFGLLFFSLSLTPSLIPRHFTVQGILCGCAFAAGYAIGVFLEWLWNFLELRWPNRRVARWAGRLCAAACLLLAISFLWFSTGWQNSIRAGMGIAPVAARQPWFVAGIAIVPAAILIGIGTVIVHGVRTVSGWLSRRLPRRVALLGAMVLVGLATATIGDGVIARGLLFAADRFYGSIDRLAGIYDSAPQDPLRSGSEASFIPWDSIGLDARTYVQSGPTAEDIETLTHAPAQAPLRVYVGLRSADTAEARAALALAEMDRIGAFDRSVLVLVMPVGTGWVEPAAIDTLEILHHGDIASVAVQYSYLTSWLSLVSEPDVGVETARALFSAVYQRWTGMPKQTRPRLYLHGLSLGAYSSAASTSLYDVLSDPFDGALWVGPPFASAAWRTATANRNPGSPVWHPEIGDGSALRFANRGEGFLTGGRWGPMRIGFLQYPSDPIVFFDYAMLYREPAWLLGPRAPSVSPLLNWYPVITFLQVALDMALAQTAPIGFGHNYAPQDYFDAWLAITQPPGWTTAGLSRLRETLSRSGDRDAIGGGWFRPAISSPGAP
ncbi:alpha/beta-hydrolase family protein [Devosia sp. PTR5]|uniref:Alpha/beta-hydrolase family protein n=1 Tax=Devosia oryzisoli TaxID=2774138 RepID=A0A927FWZ7_9HYPH|nr:alpha/beta-hydrolase family protein [Devosia oryzisoli]